MNKLDDLHMLLKLEEFNFIFIVETWLKPFHADALILSTNNYNLLRHDRLLDRGGGVCVASKSSLSSKIIKLDIDLNNNGNFEIVGFDYYFSNFKYCRFICVYLPPNNASDVNIVHSLVNLLRKYMLAHDFYLLGDFNFGKVNWQNPSSCSKPSLIIIIILLFF